MEHSVQLSSQKDKTAIGSSKTVFHVDRTNLHAAFAQTGRAQQSRQKLLNDPAAYQCAAKRRNANLSLEAYELSQAKLD